MNKVASLPSGDRADLFRNVAERMDLVEGLIEKDFWVCWILKHLFSIADLEPHILFKGGTTLSKIFGVIQRFSEDIDVAVDYKMLGFTGGRDPTADMSNTKRTKLLDEMLKVCRQYIASDFIEILEMRIAETLSDKTAWKLYVDPDDGHIVNFAYPRAVDAVPYVQPEVRLELGTHAEFIPNDRYTVQPYAAEYFPAVFDDADCPVHQQLEERIRDMAV